MKIAFVSDSGCGKNVSQLAEKGIFSIPLQVSYDGKNYQDLEELSLHETYHQMRQQRMLSTSLPAIGLIEECFDKIKSEGYELIFAVPICNGLSGTIQAMQMCAANIGIPFEYVDSYVTAIVQEYLIEQAKVMHEKNIKLEEIKERLEEVVKSCNTLLLPNDLQHLKRGGRLTPLAATLGGLLKIKPILQINQKSGGKIDVVGKVRTMHKAMDEVIDIMLKAGVDASYDITIAHADDEQQATVYREKVRKAFPDVDVHLITLVSVVGIHTGIGCQAIQYFKKFSI